MKKNIKVMGYGLWMMVVLFVSTPLTAQNAQEWQSTSTMQGSGSAYRSQVTAVGATGVAVLGASSSAPANAASRPHREQASGRNAGEATTGSNQSPLGDAVLPLLLMAAGFGLYTAVRRRKETA